MDAAGTAASWLSFAATAVGLGSLITQTSAIQERLDPYHTARTAEHLGHWFKRQPKRKLLQLTRPIPVGPIIHAKLTEGFCGINVLGVSRLPQEQIGSASWTAILALFHERAPTSAHVPGQGKEAPATSVGIQITDTDIYDPHSKSDTDLRHKPSWATLRTRPLSRHNSTVCASISRTTLITTLGICNARAIFRYSDASGHRASYASYCGHFYIEWPLSGPAMVHFHPHDSHSTATDVYPPIFRVRVNKCVQMMAGIITSADGSSFQCAFPGRKAPGIWILEYQRKGFPGAHGSRHLYNLMGGKVYEVDFLYARRKVDADHLASEPVKLRLPSTERHTDLTMIVNEEEERILGHTLDCLPWSSMSWSIHRGLKDILVAYAKPTMDKYRQILASTLHDFVTIQPSFLEENGWSPEFVRGPMADLTANSILAGSGNSGDSVRVVTDTVLLLSNLDVEGGKLDENEFWRHGRYNVRNDEEYLSTDSVVALTKCFVLEWSIDFDYQMYHDLPPELLLA